jgi:acyl-CoA hydrolase
MTSGERVGAVMHFYDRLSVAVITLSRPLHLGEVIHFLGKSTDFQQKVTSMQVEHNSVETVESGEVALQVKQKVRPGDAVFRLASEE